MNFFKINLNIKNFTYGWFIFSILFIILLASLQAYFDYKKAIQDTKISTSNITMLFIAKFLVWLLLSIERYLTFLVAKCKQVK